jgi:carbon monoxide dehydrogenase subunit G
MANWAASFPGYQSFEVVDDKVRRWTVKVKLSSPTPDRAGEGHHDRVAEPTHITFALG